MSIEAMKQALKKAFNLGQTYWHQADSENPSYWKKADATKAEFEQLVEDTCQAIAEADKQEPVDSDLLDDARAVLETIVHDQPADAFRDARALIPKLRERLGMPPIINFTHPHRDCPSPVEPSHGGKGLPKLNT